MTRRSAGFRHVFLLQWIAALSLVPSVAVYADGDRARLVPQLAAGQVLRYDIRGHVQKHTRTESRAVRNVVPQDFRQDFSGILRITVKSAGTENGKPLVRAVAEFEYPEDKAVDPEKHGNAAKHSAEFTIGSDGQLKPDHALEELAPMEALAFVSWASKFAFGWIIPERITKPGETWKSEEPEKTPGPIDKLVWERTTTYGESGTCPVVAGELCAVFLTTADLKQKSSIENSTPEEYKLYDLKTKGSAKGANESYESISLATGLLMRGTEDMHQTMEVVIAKTDGTNDVKYTIEATSQFEMLLVAGSPR